MEAIQVLLGGQDPLPGLEMQSAFALAFDDAVISTWERENDSSILSVQLDSTPELQVRQRSILVIARFAPFAVVVGELSILDDFGEYFPREFDRGEGHQFLFWLIVVIEVRCHDSI